ncbi:hypothetical protein C1645_841599 [Glomus cerebriforme]|uniref:Uncharacterized protein n=1 Tax=Glomus cerebriforme TaxID=658196 RepID=A0A397RZF3_9GLOM|nr:hypothetical protein C1645_841599 [Glomus cerebriforme]
MQNLNFLNLNIWYIAFFSFIPLVSASVASYVDNSYSSDQDLYDALLNTFFLISFVILFDVSGESGFIKKIFSIINMCLHVICAVYAICK